ncbi:MAG TPA: hypothetical protein VFD01_22390 [Candidatus Dormibacteraeota bacterium]|nr:hypothetical protein [Candidatus Dormibacteraeota bacterium]
MEPEELLAAGRDLVQRASPATAGLWPRATALLARQALEEGLRRFWRGREPGLAEVQNLRCQLVCFTSLCDRTLGDRVHQAWLALSHACHHHPYELGPTADELQGWMETVEALLARARTGPAPGAAPERHETAADAGRPRGASLNRPRPTPRGFG